MNSVFYRQHCSVIHIFLATFVILATKFFCYACDAYTHSWDIVNQQVASYCSITSWRATLLPILQDVSSNSRSVWKISFSEKTLINNQRTNYWKEVVDNIASFCSLQYIPGKLLLDEFNNTYSDKSISGYIWIDIQSEKSINFFWRDLNNKIWSMIRLGSLEEMVFRALAMTNNKDIIHINEYKSQLILEYDFHLNNP